MDRVLVSTQADIQVSLYVDGVLTDATGSPSVTVTDAAGATVVPSTAATRVSTGLYKLTLSPTNTASLGLLTATWSAVLDGANQTFTTYAEVVGGFLFTLAQARGVKPLDDVAKYPNAEVVAARTAIEQELEDQLGVALVPRSSRITLDGNGDTDLLLPVTRPRRVVSGSIDGTALTSPELAALALYEEGVLYHSGKWTEGRRNVVLVVEHGHDFPPGDGAGVGIKLAKRVLVDSPISDRATSMISEDGTTQYLVTAGVRQAIFDVPQANAYVQKYGVRFGVS